MCVMSGVYDYYNEVIPAIDWGTPQQPRWTWSGITTTPPPDVDLKKLLEDFAAARDAAAIVDAKTGQTDCVDPEKQKLELRVAELEKLLANPPEFVIVSGGNVEPGTYRVVDGKLYRAV